MWIECKVVADLIPIRIAAFLDARHVTDQVGALLYHEFLQCVFSIVGDEVDLSCCCKDDNVQLLWEKKNNEIFGKYRFDKDRCNGSFKGLKYVQAEPKLYRNYLMQNLV